MSRKTVSDALVRKINQSKVVDGKLTDPPNLDKLALFYAKELNWPGGEAWCRGCVEDGEAARLLLSLDGEKDCY